MSNLLLVLHGPPAGGKSKWIIDNNLQKHTVCPDDLRLLFAPDIINGISQKYNKQVWELHYQIVAARVSDNERLICVDGCHVSRNYFHKYNEIIAEKAKEPYRIIGVNFHHDLATHLDWNARRPKYKVVPIDVIKNMHEKATIFLENNRIWEIVTPSKAMEIINGRR